MSEWLRSIGQDVRYGARMMRRNGGFTIAAVVTLALGIGANTAIFTITSAVLLRPFPYEDPSKLVILDRLDQDGASRGCSLNRYEKVRDRNHAFSGVAVFADDTLNLTGSGEPLQVSIGRVSPNFFDLLGLKPQFGRFFTPEEGEPEGQATVVISDALWRTRFHGDPGITSKSLDLDSTSYSIVGVLPPAAKFPFMGPADLWTARYFEHSLMTTQRLRMGVGYLTMIARMRPEVSRKSALAEMEILNHQYNQENPKAPDVDPKLTLVVAELQQYTVANLRTGLLVLSIAVGGVLLIACLNVASLLLSRSLARRREIAVRTALGATRSTILRQLLTESALLALIAGAIGLGLSFAATHVLLLLGKSNLPQGIPIGVDTRVLIFTLAISVLTGLAFGIFPALQLVRTDLNSTLRDEGRGSTGGLRRSQAKNALVVGQVAVSLLLLIAAGLLVRSFGRLILQDPGFDPTNVLTMNISLPTVRYADAQKQIEFFDDLLRRVSNLPGVHSAATSAALPLTPKRITPILPEGQPDVPLAERPFIIIEATSPRFLETLHIPLRAGRSFTDADNAQAPRVVIVNEALARRFWPDQNAVGKHIIVGRQTTAEIVGVAANVKNSGLAQETQAQLYLPFPQLPWGNMNLLVRTATDPLAMAAAVRRQISAIDPDQPVTGIQTVDDIMDGSRAQPRFLAFLVGAFSATALGLAVLGIYGVLAYSVAQRRQELGIRMALGAKKSDIAGLVIRQSLALIAIGLVIGLAAALACTRFMSSMLYQVKTLDLATFVTAPAIFIAIGLLASYLPARRASTVDPTEALRSGN